MYKEHLAEPLPGLNAEKPFVITLRPPVGFGVS